MTEKRQRNGPSGGVRTPRCEAEFPPPGLPLRTRFVTQDHIIYEVCDDCVTPSMVMTKAIFHARRESSAALLRVAPPPPTAPLPAAELPLLQSLDTNVALRDNPHLLPNVGAESLEDVLRYCYFHTSKQKEKMAPAQISQWDDSYVRVDPRRLCELASAAYYLDIRDLVDLTCRAIAAIISGKTAEQIRTTFNIENDLVQSLTGMIQLDDHSGPSARRSSPASRGKRQGRHDQLEKTQVKKQPKTYSLSAIDDFGNGDAEERRDAPQLGTHSVDEVEKWINGPDPAKGNGKRRRKKRRHKSSAAQSERQVTEPDTVPSSFTPPSPPLSSPPPSPSSSSLADPSYVASSSPSSPSSQLRTRENGHLLANGGSAQVQHHASNGLHEEPTSNDKSHDVITLSSDDDEVVLVSEKKSTLSSKGGRTLSQDLPQNKEGLASASNVAKSEPDVTVKSEHASSQGRTQTVKATGARGKEASETDEHLPGKNPHRQVRKVHLSSDEPNNASANGDRSDGTEDGALSRLGDLRLDNATGATRVRIKDETDLDHSNSGRKGLAATDPKEEPRVSGTAEPNGSKVKGPMHAKSVPNGTGAQADDAGPSFIRCPDRMDKEVEDFENRLNSSDAPSAFDMGLRDSKDASATRGDRNARERKSEPTRMPQDFQTSDRRRGSIAEAHPVASSKDYDAGMRLMQNKLEQARREAQLQERKRHYEKRANDIEKQIADLLSEREKVRDELSLVKMELRQLDRERNS